MSFTFDLSPTHFSPLTSELFDPVRWTRINFFRCFIILSESGEQRKQWLRKVGAFTRLCSACIKNINKGEGEGEGKVK